MPYDIRKQILVIAVGVSGPIGVRRTGDGKCIPYMHNVAHQEVKCSRKPHQELIIRQSSAPRPGVRNDLLKQRKSDGAPTAGSNAWVLWGGGNGRRRATNTPQKELEKKYA